MKQEVLLNGMNRQQLREAREAITVMGEGYDMLINQMDRIEVGEEVLQKEIRAAKLKLNEGYFIMMDLKEEQERNSKYYENPNQSLNRQQRRFNKKNGKR